MNSKTKQRWLVGSLTAALTVSLLGNGLLWYSLHGWFRFQTDNAILSKGPEARMVMTSRRLLDEGDLDGVRKHLGFMLQAHTDYLRIVVEDDETPERIRNHAAGLLAKIEDGSLLDR